MSNLENKPNLAKDGLYPVDLRKRIGPVTEYEFDPKTGAYVSIRELHERDMAELAALRERLTREGVDLEAALRGLSGEYEDAVIDRRIADIGRVYKLAILAIIAALVISNIQEIKRSEIFQNLVAPVLKELGI